MDAGLEGRGGYERGFDEAGVSGESGRMVSRLKLRDFRCFAALDIELDAAANVFVGANAQGKTSVLEAICVLLRLQSPRISVLSHAIRHGQRGFVVDGYCGQRHLQFYYSSERKKLALDAVEQKSAREYLETARVVYFSNQDIDIVRGPAEQRRRFLDFVGQQLEARYRPQLRAYEKALRSRNRLLKLRAPRREVAAFEGPLLEAGEALSSLRAAIVEQLREPAGEALRRIGEEGLELRYVGGAGEDFARALEAAQAEDARRGMTTVGPHRDELAMSLDAVDSMYASEGQQRSVALSLKLGQARLLEDRIGEPPVLLIDDVFGELDLRRRNALMEFLPASSQRFITTTHLDWMSGGGYAVFDVSAGKVVRREEDG